MLPPKCEYNTVSAIADEIWQYCTGRNLTIFDKDHDTAKEGRSQTALGSCSQAYGFATITMYSRWQPSEIGALAEGGVEAGRKHSCISTIAGF